MADPLAELRGEIAYVHPLERAARHAAHYERIEEWQEQERRAEAVARFENQLAMQEAAERAQIAMLGHSQRELDEVMRARQMEREAKVAEAWETIERLDPKFAEQKRREAAGVSRAAEIEKTLQRSHEVSSNPFMQGQVRRFHQRRAAIRRAEAEREYREISR